MSNCIGMPRYEVEANISAMFGDRLAANDHGMDEEGIENVRKQINVEAMLERGIFQECPVHPGFFVTGRVIPCHVIDLGRGPVA